MASQVVKIEDFSVGRMAIPRTSWQKDDVQNYLDIHEEGYLIRLLGYDLYVLFLADLDANGVPQTQRLIDIYNQFVLSDDCENCRSRGMKTLLKGIIFFYYQRDQPVKATTTGPRRRKGENTENVDTTSFDITTRYNNSVDDFKCIQRLICKNIEDYPEYKGIDLDYVLNI